MNNTLSHLSLVIILALEVVLGMVMNVFILSVVCWDFLKTKTLNPGYRIVVCLACSSVCFAFLMSVGFIDYFYDLKFLTRINAFYIYLYLLLFTISSCTWLTASLGFFYFTKISMVESGLFSWMKRNISSIIPWMLLLDLLMSLLHSALSSLFFIFTPRPSYNTTEESISVISTLSRSGRTFIITIVINTSLPFFVLLVAILLTVVTLKRHSARMKNAQTLDNEHLRSYKKVVNRMKQSLLFYALFYAVTVIFYFVVVTRIDYGFLLLLIIMFSFPLVQAVLLILANPRLRTTWTDIFSCIHLQETEPRGSNVTDKN